VYETDMAEGLKAMALEGHGVAFLPLGSVKKELRSKKLVSAGSDLEMAMDVRVYRERPSSREVSKSQAQALWDYLQSQHGAVPVGKAIPVPATVQGLNQSR
jgi:LysR family transcriptional regulator, hypochlorite-specific transcription factor HypT